MQTRPVGAEAPPKMRIIGWGVVGPNEKRIESTLLEFKRLCDDVILCVNSPDKDTIDLIEKYKFQYAVDGREWGKAQHRIKEDFYKNHVAQLKPDWVVALDMDETFSPDMTRADLEALARKGGIGYYFYVVNLFDEGYAKDWCFWNIRFYKYDEKYTKWEPKALHPGLAPRVVYDCGNYAPYLLLHYGLKDKADRERKAARYKKYDPNAAFKGEEYYTFLSSDYKAKAFDQKAVQKAVEDEVKSIVYFKTEKDINPMSYKSNEYVYVRYEDPTDHTSHIVPIPVEDKEETLARPGFTLISADPVRVVGEEVHTTVPAAEAEDNTCKTCGYKAVNPFGLRSHQRKHS